MEYINEEAYKEYHEQEYVKLPECRSPDYGVRLLDLSVIMINSELSNEIQDCCKRFHWVAVLIGFVCLKCM